MLNLDWSNYNKNLVDFVKEVNKIAGNVLISSPNDFSMALDLLQKIN
jgi:hypothetical protein